MTSLPVPADFDLPSLSEKKSRFLERLSLTGNVRSACRAIAITPMTAYRWRRACRHFARGWEAALVVARAHAEEVLADRALNGVEEKVFYHGEEVATRTRYDTRLLLAHLARLDAKAEDRNLADAAEDFDAVLAHFAKTGAMPPDKSASAADDAGVGAGVAAGAPRDAPEHPWDDESLPIVERALLYLDRHGESGGDADAEDWDEDDDWDEEEDDWDGPEDRQEPGAEEGLRNFPSRTV